MASTKTENARSVARSVSKALGREVNDKRVRAWVRDHVDAFDDDGYTAHQYSAAQAREIIAGMTKAGKSGRATAARNARSTSKAARKSSKDVRGTLTHKQGPAIEPTA